jgi:D-alanyl-D-alanine carboxypeptidase/D-alanyl-D-alanine-endopeptidase (penicillin-binding protein 4)
MLLLSGCATTQQQRISLPSQLQARENELVFVKPSSLTALSTSPYPTIKAKIDSLIPDSLFPPAHVGIRIVSLKNSETLYELNPHSLFNPASNQKLFTSAAALARLGEAFPLSTVAAVDTSTRTIFIKGYGDGVFSAENLDSLARLVSERMPRGGTWRVVGDDSYFDKEYWGYGWNWDDEPEAYQMFLTSLILNGNTIKLIAKPGKNIGEKLIATTEPATNFVAIENAGITVLDSVATPVKLSRKWRDRLNVLTVEGEMRLTDTTAEEYDLSVWQPERYTTHVFAELLRKHGVIVYETAMDTMTSSAYEVARISHSLDSVVTYLNKVSDNLSAETLLKVLAAEKKANPGIADAGVSVVKEFLAENEIDTTTIRIVDGSGLSRMNLTSPAVTVQLLDAMYHSPHFSAFYKSLPIAGTDGTIRGRFRRTTAESNLRAKTGTLASVTALSGYVQTTDGEWLAFSMMMMNYTKPARAYRTVQDRIGVFLSQLQRESF